jgi:CelD/BcsL family acetyltransferase involved in cellulose biosynthesis
MATVHDCLLQDVLEPIDIDQWHDYAAGHCRGSVFHHRNWLDLLMRQYGYPCRIFAIRSGGAITAAIPFLETRGLSGKRKLISLPFTDWMEILADRDDDAAALLGALRQAPLQNYGTVVVRTDRPLAGEPVSNGWVRHELPLQDGFDAAIARVSHAVRATIRKAEHQGFTFERRTDAEAIEEFYRLHLLTRKKLGVPIQPRSFFRLFEQYILRAKLGFVAVIRHAGEAIAAAVFLTHGQMCIYKYGASHPGALQLRPNDWVIYNALRIAFDEGYSRFDFGVCRLQNEGLRHFKRKWRARELPVHSEYIVGQGSPSVEDGLPMRVASAMIRRGPAICCRAIGALLYKYSP